MKKSIKQMINMGLVLAMVFTSFGFLSGLTGLSDAYASETETAADISVQSVQEQIAVYYFLTFENTALAEPMEDIQVEAGETFIIPQEWMAVLSPEGSQLAYWKAVAPEWTEALDADTAALAGETALEDTLVYAPELKAGDEYIVSRDTKFVPVWEQTGEPAGEEDTDVTGQDDPVAEDLQETIPETVVEPEVVLEEPAAAEEAVTDTDTASVESAVPDEEPGQAGGSAIEESLNSNVAVASVMPLQVMVGSGKAMMATAAEAKENENEIFHFLVFEMGYNRAAACGVLANIHRESNFSPTASGDGGTSHGICQWHKERWTTLVNWCKANGYGAFTLEGQLHFLQYELSSNNCLVLWNGKTIGNYMKNNIPNTTAGAYEAGRYWCVKYEVPANKDSVSVTRGNLAKNTYWPNHVIVKDPQPMTVTTKALTVKYSKFYLRKIPRKKAFVVKNAKGDVTYKKLAGPKNILIMSNGQVRVKKGAKRGTFKVKVKVTASGNNLYKAGSRTRYLKVTIK